MELNNLEIDNKIGIEKDDKQLNFLESSLGNVTNTAVDIGIRAILPDFIEDQVIGLKDNMIKYGLKDGIKESIDDAINIGKNAIGIFTGNFDNITQIKEAIQAGGLIDSVSSVVDDIIDKISDKGLISNNIADTIKTGKEIILNNVESNIEKTLMQQLDTIEELEKHIVEWKTNFDNKNFFGMEDRFKLIEKEMKELVPLENTIEKAKSVELLHNLVKNNGQNFDLSKEELDLVEKLK